MRNWPGCARPSTSGSQYMPRDINVIALIKGEEKYIFLYDDAHRRELLHIFSKFAANPQLSFSWYDAAVLSQKVRQEAQRRQLEERLRVNQPAEDWQ
ncbi:MAG: hypothetical protein NZ899_10230 [Thermoguttaceae bacterium]|nr:hypothetical protein [Thermoguttaceae bacterium]MDW8078063.1 hypothetical protein [Thermoguttaceae bacterium]